MLTKCLGYYHDDRSPYERIYYSGAGFNYLEHQMFVGSITGSSSIVKTRTEGFAIVL